MVIGILFCYVGDLKTKKNRINVLILHELKKNLKFY